MSELCPVCAFNFRLFKLASTVMVLLVILGLFSSVVNETSERLKEFLLRRLEEYFNHDAIARREK